MTSKTSARRYAQAVFEMALETEELDRWQSDLKQITDMAGDTEFMTALESPRLHFDDKVKILSERLKGISPLALNLVLLLVTRGKLGIISDMAEDYQRRLDSYRGIESVEVITAIPLDAEDERKLAGNFGVMVGKEVILKTEVDPDLIGGIVARIGGKLLDGCTRSRLAALKRELVGASR